MSKKTSVGIDIGSKNIKIVELVKDKRDVRIKRTIMVPNIPNFIMDNKLTNKEKFVDIIKTIFDTHKLSKKNVTVSISPDVSSLKTPSYVVRTFKHQILTNSEMKKSMKNEIERQMPININEYYTDWDIVTTFTGDKMKEFGLIFLIAVNKKLVRSLIDAMKIAKIQVDTLDFSILGAGRSFVNPRKKSDKNDNFFLVDFGYKETRILLVSKGKPHYFRSIKTSVYTLITKIAEERGIEKDYAEELFINECSFLIEGDIGATQSEEFNWKIIKDDISNLIYGLTEVIGFINQEQELTASKMYLTGGGSKLKNLKEYLSRELEIPVEGYLPYFLKDGSVNETFREESEFFNSCIGLALRGFEKR